jgi:hypothetical protein
VEPIPAPAQAAPLLGVAVLLVPPEHADVDWHVADQRDRKHARVADPGKERECCVAAAQAACGDEARGDRAGLQERVDAGEATVDQLLGMDLLAVTQLPQRWVDDAPGGQLAAGQEPGEQHRGKRAGVHTVTGPLSRSDHHRFAHVGRLAEAVEKEPR